MPFLVDAELCRRVLAAALPGGPGAEAAEPLAEEIFGAEDRFVRALEASPVPFVVERREKGARNFVVRSGLIYIHVRSKPNLAIIAPPHFVTDYASVPASLRWLLPQTGPHAAAAVIHDWLYTVAEPPAARGAFAAERLRADRIFLEAMKASGVGPLTRSLLYRGARIGGAGGFGAVAELRFIDPGAPDRLIDPRLFDKARLRAFTLLPRPRRRARGAFAAVLTTITNSLYRMRGR
jgi:hypothetical protein